MPMAVPTIRITMRPIRPSLIDVPAKPDAIPVANGLIVEPRTPIPQPSSRIDGADERVVARGDHDRDDQRVEREALLGHPEGRAAEREHGHQDRDHPALAALEAGDDPGDAALDRAGLHRHAEEPADDEDEQRDVDGAEQLARVPDADAAVLGALDAVQAVDRRHQRVDDDPLRGRLDLVVRARDRLAVRVGVVGAGRDQVGRNAVMTMRANRIV